MKIELNRDQLIQACATNPEMIADLILSLVQRVDELERRLNQNSNNSSKPPSSDGYQKPSPKSLRGKTNKRNGGQPGHKAHWLKQSDHPDVVITHEVNTCEKCQHDLSDVPVQSEDTRQVFHIIVKMEITEHRTQTKICSNPGCHHQNQSAYPEDVNHKTQYSSSTRAFLSYLNLQQLLPLNRIREMVHALTGIAISEGTIVRANQELHANLANEEQKIKAHLLNSPVLHSDESGLQIDGKLQWLHTACTPLYTYYSVHSKRGREAMDDAGLLPQYEGTSVHDGLKAYEGYTCKHGLCNQHHHRELNAVVENDKQPWADEMIELLYEIKRRKEELIAEGYDEMDPQERAIFEDWYRAVVSIGLAENPSPVPPVGKKRGRVKQSKTKNLLDRLHLKRDAVLAFMHDFRVPFTNNEAEQAIRMIKTHQKVSGCFRSLKGAETFSRIRGFISTLRKQNLSVLDNLQKVFEGKSVLPEPATN